MKSIFKFKTIIKLFSRKGRKFYCFISKAIGYKPRNIELFETAFVHRSYVNTTDYKACNERLEFVGDAILGAIVASILYDKYPQAQEGTLSSLRAGLVSRKSLNAIAINLGFCQYIKCNNPKGLEQTHIPGDVLEAMIAAIYIDSGMKKTKNFIYKQIVKDNNIEKLLQKDTERNYKSELIVWGQRKKSIISFETKPSASDDSASVQYESIVLIDNIESGKGIGHTKKAAEQSAAKQAIELFEN